MSFERTRHSGLLKTEQASPTKTIFDEDGNVVNFFGEDAFNDDEFETTDAIILDLVLPETGTYFAQVNAFGANETGDYELFFHRFNGVSVVAVPEPSSLALGLLVFVATASRRRRSS